MKYREDIDYRPITSDQVKVVAYSLKGVDHDALRNDLDGAAIQYIRDHYEQQTFPRLKLEKRLDSVGNAAKRLLLALDVQDSIELESILNNGLGGGRDDRLSPLVAQLRALEEVARKAAVIQARNKAGGNNGNPAFRVLLGSLRQIFMIHSGWWPGFVINSDDEAQNVAGLFVNFVNKTLAVIRENLSDGVMDTDPGLAGSLNKTGKAIRAAALRLENDERIEI